MRLKKCLHIIKSTKFTVFVYPGGHMKEKGNKNELELPLEVFEIERDEKGNFPYFEFYQCKVKEIIPCIDSITVVVETD